MKNQLSRTIKQTKTVAGAGLFAVATSLVLIAQPVQAATIQFTSPRDCDNNAVLHCGALNTSELTTKYNGNQSAQVIFNNFGISKDDMKTVSADAVAGSVAKDGTVYAGDKKVATAAVTVGRQNLEGSTKVTENGVTFYTRTPSVSFKVNKIDAFVVLKKDGTFDYAVISSCGNPVKATNAVVAPKEEKPVEKPVEKPAEKPVEKPAPVVEEEEEEVVETPAPVAEEETTETLPEVGPAGMVALFSGSSLLAAAGHALYTRRKS